MEQLKTVSVTKSTYIHIYIYI